MEDVETLFDKAVDEIERMLNTKTILGEPDLLLDFRTSLVLVESVRPQAG